MGERHRSRPPRPARTHERSAPLALADLTILRWAHGGDGVAVPRDGPLAGAVVFVPGAVPGDRVRVEIVERRARWARARLLAVEAPSAERVEAPCPVQARCGGCPWMVGSARAQKEARLAILRGEARKRLGWGEAEAAERVFVAEVPGAPRFGYRPRVKLAWRAQGSGPAELGYRPRASHALAPIAACAVADAAINAALPAVAEGLGRRGGAGVISLVAGEEGVAAWVSPEGGEGYGLGPAAVTVPVGAQRHRVGPRAFLQANPTVAAAMVEAIGALAHEVGGGHAVELFAGSGALTPALWSAGFEVDAYDLEGAEAFAALAAALGRPAGADRWSRADLIGLGVPLPAPRRPPHLVLLDPPRGGAAGLMPWVRASGARRVILMSCDVATAFRDLQGFVEDPAWRLARVVGYDMFPHTGHQELLAWADRAST